MPHNDTRWVIVFLIYADFRQDKPDEKEPFAMNAEMKAALNVLFKDVIKTTIDPQKARVFVLMNGIRFKATNVVPANGPSTETKTLFFEVVNPDGKGPNQLGCFEIVDSAETRNENPNPTNPFQTEFLKKVLKKIVVEKDEQVFLITWDHGSAFGIFREHNPPTAQVLMPITHNLDAYPYLKMFWEKAETERPDFKTLIEDRQPASSYFLQVKDRIFTVKATHELDVMVENDFSEKFFVKQIVGTDLKKTEKLILAAPRHSGENKSISLFTAEEDINFDTHDNMVAPVQSETVREILSNKELATAINDWLGKPVNVLLMMNCWMMNLHSMYAFRDTVEYFAAPQGDIGTPGYNYRDILKAIYGGKASTPKKLAKTCIRTSENKRIRKRAKKMRSDCPGIVDSWKIFAMNLQVEDTDGEKLLMKQLRTLKELIDLMIMVQNTPLEPDVHSLLAESKWLYKYVRSVSYDFSGLQCMMVDIFNWFIALSYVNGNCNEGDRFVLNNDVADLIEKFRGLCERLKSEPSITYRSTKAKKIYTLKDAPFKPTAAIRLPPFGYSLFFPMFLLDISKTPFAGVIDNAKNDGLLNDCLPNWKVFLQNCIDKDISF